MSWYLNNSDSMHLITKSILLATSLPGIDVVEVEGTSGLNINTSVLKSYVDGYFTKNNFTKIKLPDKWWEET